MKPGDLIEWVYAWDEAPFVPVVSGNSMIWSSIVKDWVPIGNSLLISVNKDSYLMLVGDRLSLVGLRDGDEGSRGGLRSIKPRRVRISE